MAHQVFVSHAAQDREIASHVCDMLEAEDIACWMAPRDLKEGTDPAAGTLDGIRTSDLVLLIFSTSANSSPYVLREIERAIAYDRPVLSLHIDDVVPSASIEYYLNLWQWLEVRGGVEGKQGEILAAVRGQLTRARAAVESSAEDGMTAAATGDETGAAAGEKAARPKRWNRRTWAITFAALLVIAAATVGGIYASSPPEPQLLDEARPAGGRAPGTRTSTAMAYDLRYQRA